MQRIENSAADSILLKLIKDDDEIAFRGIFDKYFVPLCRYSDSYVRDVRIAEEVVLDVLTNLWNMRHRLEVATSLRLYLFRSVRNRSLNQIRDARASYSLEDHQSSLLGEYANDLLELEELDFFIQEAILSLPDKCREIFTESRIAGKSHKEIAESLDISVKTVETQISRAIKRIREHLQKIYTLLL